MPEIVWFVIGCVVTAVAAYLLGSINFAVLICKAFFKEDVRTKGSGNAGMTNVLRNYGKKGAVLTLFGDVGKGILAVFVGRWVFMLLVPVANASVYGAYIAGIAVILGHMFPVFFGFKGGKGVATSGGVILALQPILAIVLLSIFLLLLAISKMVSLGSVVGMSLYPVVTLLWGLFVTHTLTAYTTVCAAVIGGLVVWMHRANIKRIIAGTEYKFGDKKKQAESQKNAGGAQGEKE